MALAQAAPPSQLAPPLEFGLSSAYAESLKAFKQFDENGDGVITRDELSKVFMTIDPAHWTERRLQLLMDAADTNHDGHIHYEEFVRWLMAENSEWDVDRAAIQLSQEPSIRRDSLVLDFRQTVSRTELLKFQVDQSNGRTLGVKVDSSDGRTLLIKSINGDGLIAEWNSQNRAKQVSPGDRIIEINDLRGDAKRLMKELKKKLPMDLVFMPSDSATSYVSRVIDAYDVEQTWMEEGNFGRIKKATHKDTRSVYALKSLRRKRTTKEQFENMTSILKGIDHPNVIKLFEVFEDCLEFHMITELCSGGELFERVLRDTLFTERQAAIVMRQILAGVGYLHSRSICHRNLRPEHVLLESEKAIPSSVVKIIDFRAAQRFKEGQLFNQRVGQVLYMPPEMARGGKYDHTCDIWACGIMLYLLLSGYPPFVGENDGETLRLVQRAEVVFLDCDWRRISEEAKTLVKSLLAYTPSNRPAAAEATTGEWVKSCELDGRPFPLHGGQAKMKAYCGTSRLKKAALHEVARRLKTDQVQQLHEMFQLLDKNGDRLISFYELKEGFDKLGKQESLEDLKRLMEEVDLDGSRQIDYTEFLAATLDRKCYREEEALWAAFQVFDKDRSGSISKAEIAQVLGAEEVQGLVGSADVERVLAECDGDRDGTISFREFVALMHKEASSGAGEGGVQKSLRFAGA
uniref:Calmodulin n=1 Tax=Alexandrium monilatum TaxID=311494 RepID=A0A7S4PS37_9DINO